MTCYIEFPDYPANAMPALPDGWYDSSWHNDTCPSYTRGDERATILIDYPDAADREFSCQARFVVMVDDVTSETDDWNEALAIARA